MFITKSANQQAKSKSQKVSVDLLNSVAVSQNDGNTETSPITMQTNINSMHINTYLDTPC